MGPCRRSATSRSPCNSGEFTTILGPSGSGKTTMLSLIAGIAAPTIGRIEIGERDITRLPPAERNIGMVFQSYALFPHMTVFDNIAFPLRVRGAAARRGQRAGDRGAALVRLCGFEKRRPHQLSGGQQQRVALARAIVFKPDILLLDEPLAALDRKLREEVRIEIRAPAASLGITTIMVTHDQEEALSLSDRDRGPGQRQGRADRHARRDLSSAQDPICRRLPGPGEFRRGNDRPGRPRDPSERTAAIPVRRPNAAAVPRSAACIRPEDIRATDREARFLRAQRARRGLPRRGGALQRRD